MNEELKYSGFNLHICGGRFGDGLASVMDGMVEEVDGEVDEEGDNGGEFIGVVGEGRGCIRWC